jgi:hypothetical protein
MPSARESALFTTLRCNKNFTKPDFSTMSKGVRSVQHIKLSCLAISHLLSVRDVDALLVLDDSGLNNAVIKRFFLGADLGSGGNMSDKAVKKLICFTKYFQIFSSC